MPERLAARRGLRWLSLDLRRLDEKLGHPMDAISAGTHG